MKTLFATIILAGIFSCQYHNPAFKSVSVEAYERIIADSSVVRLDVRTAKEFAEGQTSMSCNQTLLRKHLPPYHATEPSPSTVEAGNVARPLQICLQRRVTRSLNSILVLRMDHRWKLHREITLLLKYTYLSIHYYSVSKNNT